MDEHEKRRRLSEEPDFIALKRFGYSLEATVKRYPDGAPDQVIAAALMISEAEVEKLYCGAVQMLRSRLQV